MHGDEVAHHVQAHAQAAFGARQRARPLREQVENMRQDVRTDAGAIVGHGDCHDVGNGHGQPHHALVARVFRCIAQQIGKHLGQAHRVGVHDDWCIGHGDNKLLLAFLQTRHDRFDGLRQHIGQQHRFPGQLDLPATDARRIEQVVKEARHVLDLALDHAGHFQYLGRRIRRARQQAGGHADRRQGIS
jgi:hypothetical protein